MNVSKTYTVWLRFRLWIRIDPTARRAKRRVDDAREANEVERIRIKALRNDQSTTIKAAKTLGGVQTFGAEEKMLIRNPAKVALASIVPQDEETGELQLIDPDRQAVGSVEGLSLLHRHDANPVTEDDYLEVPGDDESKQENWGEQTLPGVWVGELTEAEFALYAGDTISTTQQRMEVLPRVETAAEVDPFTTLVAAKRL